MSEQLSFPRHHARTLRFSLGAPRSFTVSPDGARVVFLRSPSGTDRRTALWVLDLPAATERLVADPAAVAPGEETLSVRERARRERTRESAAGIVGYATDKAAQVAAFALSGRLHVSDLLTGQTQAFGTAGPVDDPRPSPDGQRIAFVAEGALRVVERDGAREQTLVEPEGPDVTYGLAEFVAAEEMGRSRGFWWSPDSGRLLVARVDESPVARWHVADPAHPQTEPAVLRYPAAGTANAWVSLLLVDLEGTVTSVPWDGEAFPYLAAVAWSGTDGPLLLVQSRDQRRTQVLSVDVASGAVNVMREDADETWLEIVPGVPRRLPDGRLLTTVDESDTRRVAVDGQPLSPPGLQVREVVALDGDGVVVHASTEPTETHVWRISLDGGVDQITTTPGVHSAAVGGPTWVVSSATLDMDGAQVEVWHDRRAVATIASNAERPTVRPNLRLLHAGPRELRTALLLPTGHEPGSTRLPVLLDPYGGPHAQRVVAARGGYLVSQWFADQGFAVVVADGRGTPGRGPAWERAVAGDLAGPVLDDQIEALQSIASTDADLDLGRVGIRGWSFGGYLAALAVLRRPEVFHAAVAGAPCTDWTLYDTHYTERYLGTDTSSESYLRSSLLDDAPSLHRPLMLIHGLADDNVVSAHTLRLSSALLAAGRAHTVLPLTGVTHMTTQETVAENLLLLQLRFLKSALAVD